MAGIFCQKNTLFRSDKAASHHKDLLACEKLSVTGSTVCHSVSSKLFFTFETYHSGMSSGSQQHPKALQLSSAGLYCLHIAV